MESATLLPSSGRRAQPPRRAPALLAVAAVALLALAALTAQRHAVPRLLQASPFAVEHDTPQYARNGEKCWMCPCCAGCESTGAARAAGCFVPGAKAARKTAPVQAAKASRQQATLNSAAAPAEKPASAKPDAKPAATKPAAAKPAAAKPASVAAPKQAPAAKSKAKGAAPVPAAKKPAALPGQIHAAVPKKRLHMKHLQMKVEHVGADEARPISDNDNRLKDDMDIFEDASYLNPHKYHIPHLTKKMGNQLEEDVIAPWITGPDSFRKHTEFNEDGTIKTFRHYQDPAGLFAENPSDEEPWDFAEGKHWDGASPESKGFSNGEDWSSAGDAKLLKGEMTHGDNKKWEDIDDPQWGFDHQFADWDPDGDKNARLMWGDGGLALSGGEMPNDKRLDPTTNIYEEPAMQGQKPWELTFMDPRLEGDDFVPEDDYLASMHPEFKNPVDNQFADLDEEGKENKNLVFGDNEGAAPSGQEAIDEGKDDPAALRQRMDVPINDNWNMVSDSKVNSDTVKDLLVDRSAAVLPLTGEPVSDALTGTWMGTNGVAHSDETPGFAEANDYADNKDSREHHPETAEAGGAGGEGAAPWGR